MPRYYPQRPIKSFQDLTVYQTATALGVKVIKQLTHNFAPQNSADQANSLVATKLYAQITQDLFTTALNIPRLLATAHSQRFPQPEIALNTLDETMLACNLVVIHLSEYRDLINPPVKIELETGAAHQAHSLPHTFFEEQIKAYLDLRRKILHLQKAWVKYMPRENKLPSKKTLHHRQDNYIKYQPGEKIKNK